MPDNTIYETTAIISGLKCDHPTCDYSDPTVPLEKYKSYIDEPCPQCGSPLLTKEDYDLVQDMLKEMARFNDAIAGMDLPELHDLPDELTGQAKVMFEMNGTGTVALKNIEKYEK